MKIRMPNLGGNGAATKSTTFKNLDSVFSAISFLANYVAIKNVSALLTALNISFQRITYMVSVNATATISELKRLRLAYVLWIRGGPEPSVSPEATNEEPESVVIGAASTESQTNLSFLAEEHLLGTICIQSLIDLRKQVVSEAASVPVLWFYDVIVIGFLDINRVINMPITWDFTSIISPPTSKYHKEFIENWRVLEHNKLVVAGKKPGNLLSEAKMTENLVSHLPSLLPRLNWTPTRLAALYKRHCRAQKFYISNTAGPNGPATWTAYSDAIAIINNKKVLAALIKFVNLSGLKRFLKKLIRTVELRAVDGTPIEGLKLGKLITFAEWGGKTRTVASVDYWTQVILTPLHETLFEVLKSIEMDATFDQRAASEVVRKWTANEKSELYSFDLTAATDRLPRELQAEVLNNIFGLEGVGTAWMEILSNREYYSDDGNFYTYGTGLPMGSKSNWAMLAFTHHLIVQRAAEIAKLDSFTAYRICGDDVVINSTAVAKQYRKLMEYYGLTINESKSILHVSGLAPAAEFCKRVFIKGSEYTCLPTKLIAKTVMNGRLLPQLQNEVTSRNLALPESTLYTWLGALVDSKSHSFLAMLNKLPQSITGLSSTIQLPASCPNLSEWWKPTHELTENDMVQGYTYVAAVEQLKRLDSLLRQTAIVNDTIASAMKSNYNLDLDTFAWTKEVENKELLNTLLEFRTDLSVSHPIVEAAQAEAIRISLLLTKLSNAEMTVESAARAQVLDMFRNALSSMWQDKEGALAQADRTLITRVLDLLEERFTSLSEGMEPSAIRAALTNTFSTRLTHLERNWVVRWHVGSNVTINTMKSRVVGSTVTATNNAETNAASLPIHRKDRN